MRIVICWGGVSGYMAACWRELASRRGVDLLVFNFSGQVNTSFDEKLLAGINHHTFPLHTPDVTARIKKLILDHRADAISLSGWVYQAYRDIAADPELARIPKVAVMDTPLRRTWRQRLARFRIGGFLSAMSRIIVPGERAWQYARYLGVPEARIRRAMYGVDYNALAPLYQRRAAGGWPKRFLYTGRYVPEKGIDTLVEGYRGYRKAVADPWPLTCCGMGPLKGLLGGVEAIEDAGFMQPDELAERMAASGAFVLASRFDPWPLVVVEACAAGLPVICTEACGSSVELVRTHYSGLTVATGDAGALAHGLRWAHERHAELPQMGLRAQQFAAAYSAQAWADRWEQLLGELLS